MEVLIGEVFEAFSAVKKAYVSLQEAHCPWDPDRMRVCDAAVVAELRRIGVLRERFRRKNVGGERGRRVVGATLREVVAPYEAAVEELKRELKVKEVEVENLKDKLKNAVVVTGGSGGKKNGRGHHQSKRRVGCSTQTPGNFYIHFAYKFLSNKSFGIAFELINSCGAMFRFCGSIWVLGHGLCTCVKNFHLIWFCVLLGQRYFRKQFVLRMK